MELSREDNLFSKDNCPSDQMIATGQDPHGSALFAKGRSGWTFPL